MKSSSIRVFGVFEERVDYHVYSNLAATLPYWLMVLMFSGQKSTYEETCVLWSGCRAGLRCESTGERVWSMCSLLCTNQHPSVLYTLYQHPSAVPYTLYHPLYLCSCILFYSTVIYSTPRLCCTLQNSNSALDRSRRPWWRLRPSPGCGASAVQEDSVRTRTRRPPAAPHTARSK